MPPARSRRHSKPEASRERGWGGEIGKVHSEFLFWCPMTCSKTQIFSSGSGPLEQIGASQWKDGRNREYGENRDF